MPGWTGPLSHSFPCRWVGASPIWFSFLCGGLSGDLCNVPNRRADTLRCCITTKGKVNPKCTGLVVGGVVLALVSQPVPHCVGADPKVPGNTAVCPAFRTQSFRLN